MAMTRRRFRRDAKHVGHIEIYMKLAPGLTLNLADSVYSNSARVLFQKVRAMIDDAEKKFVSQRKVLGVQRKAK